MRGVSLRSNSSIKHSRQGQPDHITSACAVRGRSLSLFLACAAPPALRCTALQRSAGLGRVPCSCGSRSFPPCQCTRPPGCSAANSMAQKPCLPARSTIPLVETVNTCILTYGSWRSPCKGKLATAAKTYARSLHCQRHSASLLRERMDARFHRSFCTRVRLVSW